MSNIPFRLANDKLSGGKARERTLTHDNRSEGGEASSQQGGDIRPSVASAALSAAAQRMRRYRKRKKQGVRCFRMWVSNETLDVFVRRGVLSAASRNDPAAIEAAFYALCNIGLGVR
jgi:hypothetical protein